MGIKYGESYESLAQNIAPFLDAIPSQTSAKYPRWWDRRITLFIKYIDPETDIVTWYRKVINNCFFKETVTRTSSGNTITQKAESILRIPETPLYKDPATWHAMGESERKSYFTLKSDDVVIAAEVFDIPDEYTAGKRMSEFLEKYKKLYPCFEIDVVNINVGTGRGIPHYHVGGK